MGCSSSSGGEAAGSGARKPAELSTVRARRGCPELAQIAAPRERLVRASPARPGSEGIDEETADNQRQSRLWHSLALLPATPGCGLSEPQLHPQTTRRPIETPACPISA